LTKPKEALQKGDWVLLVDDGIVAFASDFSSLIKIAEAECKGKEYIISREPSSDNCFY